MTISLAGPRSASRAGDERLAPDILAADSVAVGSGPPVLLAPTTLSLLPGTVTVAAAAPGRAHAALALVLAGRLAPTGGTVTVGGDGRRAALQRAVALVDVPEVSAPDGVALLVDVVAEELVLAGRRGGRREAARWLRDRDLGTLLRTPVDAVPGAVRTAVLARLAASRPGVRHVVLVLPERHGSTPAAVAEHALSLADAGPGVLVTATPAAAEQLGLPVVAVGTELP